MDTYLHSLSLELKQNVLEVANIRSMASANCRILAADIALKTGKRISITTLKRVYGFAESRFMFSQFTLNTMAEYCGYDDWEHYVQKKDCSPRAAAYWEDLRILCHELTWNNLMTNKNESGIPYHMTIKRAALAHHLNEFIESKRGASFLCGHKGMGKTIGLTHWIEQKLTIKKKAKQDIFLYINNLPLSLSAKLNFNWRFWLTDILQLRSTGSFERLFRELNSNRQGRFFLIIEDINNDVIFKKRFDFIFKQIVEMIKQLNQYSWVKIVVTLNPPTWQKYRRYMGYPNLEKRRYHTIFCLPEFTHKELQLLAAKVNGKKERVSKYAPANYPLVTQPVDAQNFYYLKGGRLPLNELVQGDLYTISFFFLKRYLLNGSQAMGWEHVLCQLTLHLHFSDDFAFVCRTDVLSILRTHHHAYHRLLGTGIIYECQKDGISPLLSQIAFKSPCIAAYFIAKKTLQDAQFDFNYCFAAWYDRENYPKLIKRYVLHWLMILYIESNALLRAYLSKEVSA